MLNCPKCRSFNLKLKTLHKKLDKGPEYVCLGCNSVMERAKYRRTTPYQRELMVSMRQQGLSQRAIAKVLGVAPAVASPALQGQTLVVVPIGKANGKPPSVAIARGKPPLGGTTALLRRSTFAAQLRGKPLKGRSLTVMSTLITTKWGRKHRRHLPKKKRSQAAAVYVRGVKKVQQETFQRLIIDEIYTFVGRKSRKVYVWTARAERIDGTCVFFATVSTSKAGTGLLGLLQQLPRAAFYYADKNPVYGELVARQRKGVQTNRVESFNSQLRQYVGYLRRKTKAYAKREDFLQQDLCLTLNLLNGFSI